VLGSAHETDIRCCVHLCYLVLEVEGALIAMMNKLIKFIAYPLKIFQPFKVLSIVRIIKKLEKEKEFEKADKLRTEWLSKVKFKNSAPLLFSQGNYHLGHTKNYLVAFSSFDKAVSAYYQQPFHYSAINPLDLYYGCTVSAIMIGEFDKGKEYFKEVKKYYNMISSRKHPSDYAKFYKKGIEWIEESLKCKGVNSDP